MVTYGLGLVPTLTPWILVRIQVSQPNYIKGLQAVKQALTPLFLMNVIYLWCHLNLTCSQSSQMVLFLFFVRICRKPSPDWHPKPRGDFFISLRLMKKQKNYHKWCMKKMNNSLFTRTSVFGIRIFRQKKGDYSCRIIHTILNELMGK